METKHILALVLFLALGCGSMLATAFSQRLRDLVFLAMICCSIFAEQCDVNFFGEYWYRGTARGFGISVTDVLALSLIVATWANPRYPARPGFVPMGFGALLAYFGYCIFSAVTALQPSFAGWELANVVRGIVILVAGALFLRTRREFALLVIGLSATMCVQLAYGLQQRFEGGMFRAIGTMEHANSLSMYVCMVGPLLLAATMSEWARGVRIIAGVGVAAASLCVLLSISRAGLPIYVCVMLGTAMACSTWQVTRRKVLITASVLLVYGLAFLSTWDRIQMRYSQATLSKEYLEAGDGRGVYLRWAAAILRDHPLGVGLNNWSYAVTKTYGPAAGFHYEDYDAIQLDAEKANIASTNYAAPAHSLAALTLGELGFPGFALFTLVWFQWFRTAARFFLDRLNQDPMHRLGLGLFFATCGIFLQSTTEWSFRQSTIFLMFHLMIGGLASLHWLRWPATVQERGGELESFGFSAAPRAVVSAATNTD